METVVSGIRSTGNLHLGNYFGAVKNFVKMQETNNCFFFIADYHSLTTHPTPENLQMNVRKVLAEYIASGLDPDKSALYLQSDLPETAELYLLLNMNAYVGELERSVTFKEKVRKHPDNVNAGLLTYPVLMAADILIHNAHKVPVGKDQEQHLEMTKKFGRRFNQLYKNEYFREPEAFNFKGELVKVPGLDGSGKMGKSEGPNNAIFLADSPEQIKKKVMKAVTDSGPTQNNQEKPDSIKNIFTLMNLVSEKSTIEHFEDSYNKCSIRYGDLKKQLAEDITLYTTDIRTKILEIEKDQDFLAKVAKQGAEKAHDSARKTVNEVREIIGFKKFY